MVRRDPLALWCRVMGGLVLLVCAIFLILLVRDAWPVLHEQGLGYLFGTRWFYRAELFGILPLVYGTAVVSVIALALAAPLGLGAALFLAEHLHGRVRLVVKGMIELLAGIPSVVYGLIGVLTLRRWVYDLLEPFEPLSGDTLLTGGLLLAVMILPTVTTFADDALRGVPASQRRAARALGLTRAETAWAVVLPRAAPGLLAAVLLALGRAMGETIAVFLVIGRQDNQLPGGLFDPRPVVAPGQTLTTKLGGSETFIAYGEPLHWAAMVGLALVLLVLVLGLTLAGVWLGRLGGGHAARA